MRVMLDTNILISAFIFKSKKMTGLIQTLTKNHRIVICSYVIEELSQLSVEKFHVQLKYLKEFFQNFSFELIQSPKNVENKLFKIRDENDYIILHSAIISNVDIFITGDKDFKDVQIDRPIIMTATEFLEKYSCQ